MKVPVRLPPVNTMLAGARATCGAVQLLVPGYSAEQLLGGPLEPPGLAARQAQP